MNDLISRQAAIDVLDAFKVKIENGEESPYSWARKRMSELPSAQKTGRWIKISPAGIYECSECGKNVMTSDIDAYEFCHGCGAKMEVENESVS